MRRRLTMPEWQAWDSLGYTLDTLIEGQERNADLHEEAAKHLWDCIEALEAANPFFPRIRDDEVGQARSDYSEMCTAHLAAACAIRSGLPEKQVRYMVGLAMCSYECFASGMPERPRADA